VSPSPANIAPLTNRSPRAGRYRLPREPQQLQIAFSRQHVQHVRLQHRVVPLRQGVLEEIAGDDGDLPTTRIPGQMLKRYVSPG
jgi:hypothetical protein